MNQQQALSQHIDLGDSHINPASGAKEDAPPDNEADRPTAPNQSESQKAEVVPACPQCSKPMVLRTVKKAGPHYGRQFWGCPDFPKCRGVRPFEEQSDAG